MSGKPYVCWLEQLANDNYRTAGKKCYNLGEMIRAGMPVPPGYAVTLDAYEQFVEETGLGRMIIEYLDPMVERLKEDINLFEEASRYIRNLVEGSPMPEGIKEPILTYYRELSKKCNLAEADVAVRSSGPVSMPGQFDTFLNVKGEREVIDHVVKVWASSFTGRAMAYRLQRGMRVESSPIGVAVLKMVKSKSSGVMFTLDPVNGDRSRIFIEGSWGLGESLVSGQVTPDKYVLDKVTLEISKRIICNKTIELVYDEGGNVKSLEVPPERRDAPCLSDGEIIHLARLGKMVEKHWGIPQDMEWAIDADLAFPENIILVQTRPETVWTQKPNVPLSQPKASALDLIAGNLLTGKKLFTS
ncbi:MAG TPA: PEP/pyruvate-binding domain-containing protein [Spirochaetia bacterium]|nr:PEP/pyruvate-binding domain-containing protein [Spirochaetia bacterium]